MRLYFPYIRWLLLTLLLFVNIACTGNKKAYEIRVRDKPFKVKLAITPEDQQKGLAGVSSLASDEGMLFIYSEANSERVFWMKGMEISIDIFWINTGRIVHMEKNVPPPKPDVPESRYPLYGKGILADSVLEVAAGTADEMGLIVGDKVYY